MRSRSARPASLKRQPPEPVVDMRIDPGIVEHEIGPDAVEHGRQQVGDRSR